MASDPHLEQRRFTVDDLFELEDVGWYYGGPYAWTADGTCLAMTRVRAKKTLANHKWEYLWGNAGADVWVRLDSDARFENLTNGVEDGSGWWAPQWSPDGARLAMLSTRGDNVHLWVWDRRTRKLDQVSDHGVGLFPSPHERPFLWVDSGRLLCPILPDGELPFDMQIELQTPMIATKEWPKAPLGEESTANVLDSVVATGPGRGSHGKLMLFDIEVNEGRILADATPRSPLLSPNSAVVAFTAVADHYQPRADEPLGFGSSDETTTVHLVGIDHEFELRGKTSRDVVEGSLRWSPSGDELAFLGYSATRDNPPALYRANLTQQTVDAHELPGLDAAPGLRQSAQLEWLASGDLAIYAARSAAEGRATVTSRRDWWLIRRGDPPRALTAQLPEAPAQLWPDLDHRSLVGVAAGHLWRIQTTGDQPYCITEGFETTIDALTWPAMTNAGPAQYRIAGRTYPHVIFSVGSGSNGRYYLLDLGHDSTVPIEKPDESADLVAYEPRTTTAIFQASGRDGLHVWQSNISAGGSSLLASANQFLAGVTEAEFRSFDYTSLNGETLKAWLLLPVDYEEGRRYPLLTWVYAGSVQQEQPPTYEASINTTNCFNMQIPAANGYAVLFPSMPLSTEGVTDDPMLRLPEGVLPAVDMAVTIGVADPDRLFLMGQSFGGYSTYGLVTQTSRFRAAIACAGMSNLISLYGQFDARVRYTDHPHEHLFQAALIESAQIRMGNPPWKDLGRYLRNSPIFNVDRVNTPLMIVQGDLDYIAIQQGEEFFMALRRQGKPARFVRYWGEGHVLESPANIRDFWRRTFDWLEQTPDQARSA